MSLSERYGVYIVWSVSAIEVFSFLLCSILTRVNQKISSGQRDAFRFIAYTEIFLFLVVLWNVIS